MKTIKSIFSPVILTSLLLSVVPAFGQDESSVIPMIKASEIAQIISNVSEMVKKQIAQHGEHPVIHTAESTKKVIITSAEMCEIVLQVGNQAIKQAGQKGKISIHDELVPKQQYETTLGEITEGALNVAFKVLFDISHIKMKKFIAQFE